MYASTRRFQHQHKNTIFKPIPTYSTLKYMMPGLATSIYLCSFESVMDTTQAC